MCPLAEVLRGMGLLVQGSDMSDSDSVVAPARPGHLRFQWATARKIWATATSSFAPPPCTTTIPEISGAVARGIPVYERAQAWGAIMRNYPNALCVSGTHGKTTTTSMCTHIFMAAARRTPPS
jgi:UDP-N-acetylmuramate--alanine ligase